MRVKCLAQEHNAMSPARAQTRAARPGDERTNHEATAAPTIPYGGEDKTLSHEGEHWSLEYCHIGQVIIIFLAVFQ